MVRSIIDAIHDPVFVLKIEEDCNRCTITELNRIAASVSKLSHKDCIGRDFLDFIDASCAETSIQDTIKTTLQRGKASNEAYFKTHEKKSIILARLEFSLLNTDDGFSVLCIVKDIGAQKEFILEQKIKDRCRRSAFKSFDFEALAEACMQPVIEECMLKGAWIATYSLNGPGVEKAYSQMKSVKTSSLIKAGRFFLNESLADENIISFLKKNDPAFPEQLSGLGINSIWTLAMYFHGGAMTTVNLCSQVDGDSPFLRKILKEVVSPVFRDSTSRLMREAEDRELRKLFELNAKASGTGFWEVNLDNGKIKTSESMRLMMGESGKISTRNHGDWREKIHPADRPSVEEKFRQCMSRGTLYDCEYRIRHKNGSYMWVHSVGHTIKRENSALMYGITVDISDRKQAVEKLAVSQNRYSMLFEGAKDAIFIYKIDFDGEEDTLLSHFLEVNETATEMTGYSRTELLNMRPHRIFRSASDGSSLDSSYFDELLSGRDIIKDVVMQNKGGYCSEVEIHAQIIDDDGDKIVMIIARDITERKHSEMRLKLRNELGMAAAQSPDLRDLISVILKCATHISGIDRSAFYSISGGALVFEESCGSALKKAPDLRAPELKPSALKQIMHGYSVLVNSRTCEAEFMAKLKGNDLQSGIFIPLKAANNAGFVLLACSSDISVCMNSRRMLECLASDSLPLISNLITEEALRQKQNDYKTLLDNLSELILKTDMDGNILFASSLSCNILEKKAEMLSGANIADFIYSEDMPQLQRFLKYLNSGAQRRGVELRLNSVEGLRWYHWNCSVTLQKNSSPENIVWAGRDIHPRKMMESRLKDEERRLKSILESTCDGSWERDIHNGTITLDPRFAKFLLDQNSAVTMEVQKFFSMIHPEDAARIVKYSEACEKSDELGFECTHRFLCANGSCRWVQARATMIRDSDGIPLKLIGTIDDLTTKKRYDDLKEHYEFQQKMIDVIPVPVFYKDADGLYIGYNHAFASHPLLGGKSVIGRTLKDAWIDVPESLLHELEEDDRRLLQYGGNISRNIKLKMPDGAPYHAILYKSAISLRGESYEFIIGALVDVTEMKRAEAALKDTEHKLNTILDSISEIVVYYDESFNILWGNKSFYDFMRKNGIIDSVPLKCHQIFCSSANLCEHCPGIKCMSTGKPETSEISGRNGSSYQIYGYPVHDDTGQMRGFIAILSDITEKKQIAEENERHRRQLLQSDRLASLGTVVAGVAHEINNPTSFITMNLPILMECWKDILPILNKYYTENGEFSVARMDYSEISKEIPKLCEDMLEGASRIRNIVADLKDFSKDTPADSLVNMDINEILKKALSLTRNTLKKTTNNLMVELDHDLPQVHVSIQKIEQVFVNLIINACQALPGSSSGIKIVSGYNETSSQVFVSVQDEGIGINPENVLRIFDPFFTTKRDSGGTGLGLAISYSIIKEHHGTIDVESTPGKGTTFTVKIPKA